MYNIIFYNKFGLFITLAVFGINSTYSFKIYSLCLVMSLILLHWITLYEGERRALRATFVVLGI